MRNLLLAVACVAFGLAATQGCIKGGLSKSPGDINFSELPFKNLSDYGLFAGQLNELSPTQRVVPYEPVASLFTDYAFKKRFVWMPENTAATVPEGQPDMALNFPDKTILVKNFYYPTDFAKPEGQRRLMETRLLVKRDGKWEAFPYVWNDTQTEAQLKTIGAALPVHYKNAEGLDVNITYAVPNKNQCKSCHHRNNTFTPIGLKVKQLDHDYAYRDGKANQLKKWVALGLLKAPAKADTMGRLVNPFDTTQPLALRARSYLDTNCGHCHSQGGPAATSGLYLNMEENRPFHLGIMKSPVAAGIGAGNLKYDVYPKHGKESIFTYRMNSVHPGIMMPEIGRVTIHKEGVKLIEDWINSL